MNEKIIPTIPRSITRNNFIADIEAWKNFAQRITKNPFVKEFLLERDGCNCAWCKGKLVKSKIIHHISYQHTCSYNRVIIISAPTLDWPSRTKVIPDCENCKVENNERFMSCMDKLAIIHNYCNKKISEKTHLLVQPNL